MDRQTFLSDLIEFSKTFPTNDQFRAYIQSKPNYEQYWKNLWKEFNSEKNREDFKRQKSELSLEITRSIIETWHSNRLNGLYEAMSEMDVMMMTLIKNSAIDEWGANTAVFFSEEDMAVKILNSDGREVDIKSIDPSCES